MFQVPAGIDGCYVPVAVEENGVVGGGATIAVSASGSTCSDSILGTDLIAKLAAGGTVDFGFIQMYAIVLRNESLPSQLLAPDYAAATFSEFTPQTAGWANYGVSNGYCLPFLNDPDASPGQLDAGPSIILKGPSTATIPQEYPGYGQYFDLFSNGIQFYWSGLPYTVSGAGGPKVGAFSANDTTSVPTAYLSGIVAGQTLSRSGDLTVTWTGGDPSLQNGQVTIAAYSGSADGSQNTYFMCIAPLAAQSFTIPKWILSTLIPTGTDYIGIAPVPNGFLWIGQMNNPVTFQASGLDRGILVDEFFNGFPVYFK
jgi:hypothetical protein